MAYTRFNIGGYRKSWFGNIPPSDTYIYGGHEGLICCSCRLMPIEYTEENFDRWDETRKRLNLPLVDRSVRHVWWGDFVTTSRCAMLKHMKRHRKAGHAIPKSAYKRLWREYKAIGDEY
jgi:hypothetical protein